jgi:hypothetical protein
MEFVFCLLINGFEKLVHTSSGYRSKSGVEERNMVIELGSAAIRAVSDPVRLRRMAKEHVALERPTS